MKGNLIAKELYQISGDPKSGLDDEVLVGRDVYGDRRTKQDWRCLVTGATNCSGDTRHLDATTTGCGLAR